MDAAQRLRSVAATNPSLADLRTIEDPSAFIEHFSDEHAHRRSVDRPFLTCLLRRAGHSLDAPTHPHPATIATALWHALATAQRPPASADVPLTPLTDHASIEVWTEELLCALHAASWLARTDPAWHSAVDAHLPWIVEHLEPDNATRHPWSVHLFLTAGDPALRLYADEQLHACRVQLAYPDRLSALILLDAAAFLEERT